MIYPRMSYREVVGTLHLRLRSFNGLVRDVLFADASARVAAMADGRAAIDCTAVEAGFLPRGAVHVSVASAGSIAEILQETEGSAVTPLSGVRLAFSLKLLAERSTSIDLETDAAARQARPVAAARYEAIVQALLEAR